MAAKRTIDFMKEKLIPMCEEHRELLYFLLKASSPRSDYSSDRIDLFMYDITLARKVYKVYCKCL